MIYFFYFSEHFIVVWYLLWVIPFGMCSNFMNNITEDVSTFFLNLKIEKTKSLNVRVFSFGFYVLFFLTEINRLFMSKIGFLIKFKDNLVLVFSALSYITVFFILLYYITVFSYFRVNNKRCWRCQEHGKEYKRNQEHGKEYKRKFKKY